MKRFFVLLLACIFLMGFSYGTGVLDSVSKAILELHTEVVGDKDVVVWYDCGKRIKQEDVRDLARLYSDYILSSIKHVKDKTNEDIDPMHVVALLYRESSDDSCAIGRKELKRFFENSGEHLDKKEIVSKLKQWRMSNSRAHSECKERGKSVDLGCLDNKMSRDSSSYRGIYGWDIGIAQYRWPGSRTNSRQVEMPYGDVINSVGISDLMESDISIEMLVEDLASYKKICRNHSHYVRGDGGRKTKLDVEDAYYVHHHTGDLSWDETYWKRVRSHLDKIARFEPAKQHSEKLIHNN